MNIKELIDKIYADYIHNDFNTYNRNYIYKGLIKIEDKIRKMSISNFNDIVDFYISIYNYTNSNLIVNEKDKIRILKLEQENILIFISDNTDYNVLKNFNEKLYGESKLIIVCKSLLYCIVKKYLKRKLLQEYDILNFNNNEVIALTQEIDKIFN